MILLDGSPHVSRFVCSVRQYAYVCVLAAVAFFLISHVNGGTHTHRESELAFMCECVFGCVCVSVRDSLALFRWRIENKVLYGKLSLSRACVVNGYNVGGYGLAFEMTTGQGRVRCCALRAWMGRGLKKPDPCRTRWVVFYMFFCAFRDLSPCRHRLAIVCIFVPAPNDL